MSARCRGCGAPIEWRVTSRGKKMPLDTLALRVVLDASGPLRVFLDEGEGQVVAARHADERETAPTVEGRTSHFATCPKAAQFRGASS